MVGTRLYRVMKRAFLLAAALSSIAACTDAAPSARTSDDELRGLNKREALAELAQIGDAIRAFYGPLEYKEKRFGFDLDAALATARSEIEAGSAEADFVRPVYRLIAKLHDGHVSYQFPLRGDASSEFQLPLVVEPMGDAYVVAFMRTEMEQQGVVLGDTLVSIDGRAATDLAQLTAPLSGSGIPESEKHFAAFEMTFRPFYTPPELRPSGPTAHVVLQHADGTEYSVEATWRIKTGGFGGGAVPAPQAATPLAFSGRIGHLLATEASLFEMGDLSPFFLTPEARDALGVVEVEPSAETLASFGVVLPESEEALPDSERVIQLQAYTYTFEGKRILLVRVPTYQLANGKYADNVGWLGALLKDNADTADVVVLDDSHNPGGSIGFGTGIVSLFTDKPIPNVVSAHHADRKWMESYNRIISFAAEQPASELAESIGATIRGRLTQMEAAQAADQWLAPFVPFGFTVRGPAVDETVEQVAGENLLAPHPAMQWTKPVLVLIDELAGSCADIVPMLLKNGGVAKTFGTRTMGLGGNVEEVMTMPFSRAKLSLTRGLFGSYKDNPADIPLIENNGVLPDYPYRHTLVDRRAGFVGYVKAFSHTAATITR
jgi:hypothetical protein